MADNVNLTAGDGTIVAGADVIGGVAYPRAKLVWGPDNTVNDADVASGKPLPVQLRTATGTAATFGAGASDSGTVRVTVDSGQLSALGSAVSASSQPVVIASDQAWGVGAAGFTKLEDAASADGDKGVPALVVRKATPANTSGTDGDYEFLQASAGSLWTASVATDKTLVSERVINGGSQYETVAASQTNQVMGATGAAGDYLSHVLVSPGTASCGVVTVLDNATAIASFPGGGTTALSNLIPFVIPIGIISTSGAWKITTGANVTAVGVGRFT